MYTFTDDELATILASLRHFQMSVDRTERIKEFPDHFDECEPLNDQEIDQLCARLLAGTAGGAS